MKSIKKNSFACIPQHAFLRLHSSACIPQRAFLSLHSSACIPNLAFLSVHTKPTTTTIEIGLLHTMAIDEIGASYTMAANTWAFSTTTLGEAQGSQVEWFTVKKSQENADEWSDTSIWPTGMLNILLRERVDRFIFGHFNYQNDEIDDAIYSYDHGAMELNIFGNRVHLELDLVSIKPKIHEERGQF